MRTGTPVAFDEYPVQLDRDDDGKVEEAFFRFTCQPMRNAGGAVEGLMVVALDVTAQVTARAQAELASRTKDEFLAVLGHELRNPLAPLLTALRLMQMKGVRADELAVMERQIEALLRLVDDLMDVSRITRGKIELKTCRIELSTVVAMGLETASPLLERFRHPVSLDLPAEGLLVEGDSARLSQVVSNLLTNAAKYSDPGSEIELSARRNGASVLLSIRDRGIGIAPELLAQIFEMFAQDPQSRDRSGGGIGLGLAIVRSLVELHRGKVWAVSDGPGRGSEFIVELPLATDVDADVAPTPRRGTRALGKPGLDGSRILIVDDNEDGAELLAEFLAGLGYEVRTAHDGPSAIALASAFRPGTCLVDIGLPVMDGYELARRLREIEGLPDNLRLIALTGYGQESDRQRSRQAGLDAHLVKPVDLELLARSLQT